MSAFHLEDVFLSMCKQTEALITNKGFRGKEEVTCNLLAGMLSEQQQQK